MNWINIKERLPRHLEHVLVHAKGAYAVVIFADSIEVKKTLEKIEVSVDPFELEGIPFVFCSQEKLGSTVNGVTHWMPLPESPNELD